MNKSEQIRELIKYLEIIQERPKFHFGDTVPPVVNFLWGFHLACYALGLATERDQLYNSVQSEHGWEINAMHPAGKMQEAGLNQEEVIHELLAMELETWRKVYDEL